MDPMVRDGQLEKIRKTTRSEEYRERRSKTHWARDETDDHAQKRVQNRHNTFMKKREARLANATPEERQKLERQYRKADKRLAKKRKYSVQV